MALKHSYTLLAPVYDAIVSGPIDTWRQRSLQRINNELQQKILINGIGSGLDIPYLSAQHRYIGTDITPAMLDRARRRARQNIELDIQLDIADSQRLPFENDSFDAVVMHLILAVVPEPVHALQEASRVLKPGGRIYIFDKFIRPGQAAMFRRLLNIFIRHIATRTDVVFESVLKQSPELSLVSDEPALAKGWFRLIELQKMH
jgi:phosphatidylethanolamine/phosphatidyl-N-methylethanolamine N-methyltransferase